MQGLCSWKKVMWKWVEEILQDIITTKTCCVKYTWSLTGQWYLQFFQWCLLTRQASVTVLVWWVYNECTNSISNAQNSGGTASKRLSYWLLAELSFLWCIGCSIPGYLMLPSDVSNSSGKVTPWNQSLCPLYSLMVQRHVYTTGLVVPTPNPFCTVGLPHWYHTSPLVVYLGRPHCFCQHSAL